MTRANNWYSTTATVPALLRALWGQHLHHWIARDESKETTQLQLVELLAQIANIQANSKILDRRFRFPSVHGKTQSNGLLN